MADARHQSASFRAGWWLAEQFGHALLYFTLARIGQLLAIPPGNVTPFWPASGYALVVALRRGHRCWLGIWLGSFAGNTWAFFDGASLVGAITSIACGSAVGVGATLQAVFGARLLAGTCDIASAFHRVQDVLGFTLVAVVSCLLSASIGSTSMTIFGAMSPDQFAYTWTVWYLGDTTGVVLAAPLLLTWATRERLAEMTRIRIAEAAVVLSLLIVTAGVVFTAISPVGRLRLPIAFSATVPLLWGTLRFQQFFSALLVMILAIFAVVASASEVGPFGSVAPSATLLISQVYVALSMTAVLSLSAVMRDRAEVESRLRANEKQFRQTLEAVSDGWWEWNVQTGEVRFSDRWLQSWGYTREEIEPHIRGWQQLVHPDDLPKLNQALEDHFTNVSQVYECEYRIRNKAGDYAWSQERGKVVRFDQSGAPLWMVGTDTNISGRKQTESELYATERRLQQIVDNTSAVIYVKDTQFRYLLINRRFEELFGVTNSTIRGREDFEIFPREAAEGFRKNDLQVLTTGETLVVEEVAPHDDGPHTYISVKIPLRDESSRIYAVAGISTDITDRKRAEESLAHHAAELVRKNRDLRVFAYAASHDLQEPLRAIAGYSQLLQQQYRGRFDEQADHWIEMVVDGAKRMKLLLSDLLDFSHVNTQAREPEPTEGCEALRMALDNLKGSIEERDAVVTYDPLPVVEADPVQFVQLFQNLIGNAIKYCDQQPRIHVSASRCSNHFQFSVRDNGIGIAPEHREMIFQLFKRLHNREVYPGTGIGLAICHRIIERHKGRIWVESNPDGGSVFVFTLNDGD